MSSKIKDVLESLKNRKKKKNSNIEIDKYENIINKKIEKIKKYDNLKKEKFNIGNYSVTRKIPNADDLKKVYDNFLKNHKHVNEVSKLFQYNYKIDYIRLTNENKYLLFNLNLKKEKKYLFSLKLNLQQLVNISFIFTNESTNKIFNIDNMIDKYILFNTNILNTYGNYYNKFYVLFKKSKEILIKDLEIMIVEINNNINYNINLLKYDNKIKIF